MKLNLFYSACKSGKEETIFLDPETHNFSTDLKYFNRKLTTRGPRQKRGPPIFID